MMRSHIGRLMIFGLTLALVLSVGISSSLALSPEIVIEAPASGEALVPGSQFEIKWDIALDHLEYFQLFYTTDGGEHRSEITSGTGDDFDMADSYAWTVPNQVFPTVQIGIRIMRATPFVIYTYENLSGEFSIRYPIHIITPIQPDLLPITLIPTAPGNLSGELVSASSIRLNWQDNSINEANFLIDRAVDEGSFTQMASVAAGATGWLDAGVTAGHTYLYRVRAANSAGSSDYSNIFELDIPASSPSVPPVDTTILRYTIGQTSYLWNGMSQSMDVAPIIREGRTLLPIRYVADPLGAQVLWNAIERKVSIQHAGRSIEMWIDNPIASIDSSELMIDPQNSRVMPVVIPPGRTMLPLRFIADNLNCSVQWLPETREVVVTYPRASSD